MRVKVWIGDIHDTNNVHPRILILTIIIALIFGILIMISQNYSEAAMLGGILLISLDKLFTRVWLYNKTGARIPKSKIQATFEFLKKILRFGLYEDYFGLVGTGIIISVIFSEMYRVFFGGCTTILAIPWYMITNTA